jgi:hypothetical protein
MYKLILFLVFILFPCSFNNAHSNLQYECIFVQGGGIKFYENGVVFIVYLDGSFDYTSSPGARVSYGYDGSISRIGDVFISYNYEGNVSKIGSVFISYNYSKKISKIGCMYISYDYYGRLSNTSGNVKCGY